MPDHPRFPARHTAAVPSPRAQVAAPTAPCPLAALESRARAGDRDALARWFVALTPRLRAAIRRVLPGASPSDLDDVLQSAFLAALDARAALAAAPARPGAAWLATVAAHTARNHRRAARRYAARVAAADALPPDDATPAPSPASPEDRLDLARSLAALAPLDAEALLARVVHGATLDEVADAQGVAVHVVRARCDRALAALRRHHARTIGSQNLPRPDMTEA